jgi:Zn-dependent M28 family amino/carboxypeptidase
MNEPALCFESDTTSATMRKKHRTPEYLCVLCLLVPWLAASDPVVVRTDLLQAHVKALVSTPEPRQFANIASLNQAAAYIESTLVGFGCSFTEQAFPVRDTTYKNIIVRIGSGAGKKIVVGAHYDVCGEQDGADDNASGVAGLLELARLLKERESSLTRTYELAFYTLEEPPFFDTRFMGSYVHATSLASADEKLEFMVALEMIGYYTTLPKSQRYPIGVLGWFYPSIGNFVSVIGNWGGSRYANKLRDAINKNTKIKCCSLCAPTWVPGLGLSDHANFWGYHYHALMITDSAFYRNHNYHRKTDKMSTLDFDRMSEVVKGLATYLLSIS